MDVLFVVTVLSVDLELGDWYLYHRRIKHSFICIPLLYNKQIIAGQNTSISVENMLKYNTSYLFHNWPRICSVWRNHNLVLSYIFCSLSFDLDKIQKGKTCYSEEQVISMLEFLIDNIFVSFGGGTVPAGRRHTNGYELCPSSSRFIFILIWVGVSSKSGKR